MLTKRTNTIYEGYLGDIENDISVVMIDEPEDKSRLVCIFITHCNNTLTTYVTRTFTIFLYDF